MTEATALQRKWRWQINMGTAAVEDWQTVVGLQEFTPSTEPTDQEDNDYESDGWGGSTRTMLVWGIEGNISHRKDTSTHVENAVHAKLRLAATAIDPEDGVIHMRWFDKNGSVEAYEGYGLITWAPDGGGMADLERVSITVTPSATSPALVTIANPVNASPVPIVSTASPSSGAAAGGELVTITGAHFTGASAVTFDAVAAEDFAVISDTKISAITPAGSAGAVDVVVTTTNGASTTGTDAYTYTA
ncbi:phage tail tube protein [Glycomyces arizonensis]|uniref:phage tail tube protein n=1 Tax=Glycomyces arizonensis TaxID=256035 RepID=UPI00040FFAC7|nr:IPT/TIG domain-containing protein [Glycomyces arizonensis]